MRSALVSGLAAGLVLLLGVARVAAEDTVAPPEPWIDADPLSIPPAELLSAAYAHPFPEGRDVLMLLHDERVTLDEDGRATSEIHQIYRVLTPDGVRAWSNVELFYSPLSVVRPPSTDVENDPLLNLRTMLRIGL